MINKYPTLFYFFNKYNNIYEQLKEHFNVAYHRKKIYLEEYFYCSFYFWIFGLRVLSSFNCIDSGIYKELHLANFISNILKQIFEKKINSGKNIGTKWINILLENVKEEYEDENIINIYKKNNRKFSS